VSLLVTILTGSRPLLLERTLASLKAHHGPLMQDAETQVMHNGGDWPTVQVLDRYPDLVGVITVTPTLYGIGEAVSKLFELAAQSDAEYLLHLEDDWEAYPGDWYHQAVRLLEDGAFQVRLRRSVEHSLPRHMVTKRPIRWVSGNHHRFTADAHYTLNPSLIRLADVRKGWPATGEQDAQRKFWEAGCRQVAQLVPGIWSHIGGEDSLRRRVGT
jgi:hypothetical protein